MTSTLDRYLKKTNEFVSDERILINIIRDTIFEGDIPNLEPNIFESEYKLPPLPSKFFNTRFILKTLSGGSNTSPKFHERIKLDQIEFLFPQKLMLQYPEITKSSDDDIEQPEVVHTENEQELRDSLFYAMSRIILGNIPNSLPWVHKVPGLNHLTHSFLVYHLIAQATNNHINWIEKVNTSEEITNPMWSIRPLIPDSSGLLAENWTDILEKVRSAICILRLPILKDICRVLSGISSSQPLSHSAAADIWKDTTKTPRKKKRIVEQLITERFVPVLPKLDLRYRVIMIPKNSSSIKSKGLVERHSIHETIFSQYHVISIHIEPAGTQGPDISATNIQTFIAEKETISFRMDLFDFENDEWRFEPWMKPKRRMKKNTGWLLVEPKTEPKDIYQVNSADVAFLSLLWANRGSNISRRDFFDLVSNSEAFETKRKETRGGEKLEKYIDRERLKRVVSSFISNNVMNVMYHPVLHYSALPENIVLTVNNEPKEVIDKVRIWALSSFPFSRVLHSERDIIVFARTPIFRGNLAISYAKEMFEEMEITHHVGVSKKVDRFMLTAMSKLYNEKLKTWRDPWN